MSGNRSSTNKRELHIYETVLKVGVLSQVSTCKAVCCVYIIQR